MKEKEAQKSFEQLKSRLKNRDLSRMVLLYGEERYFRLQYFSRVMKYFNASKRDMNTDCYEGKGINIGAVIDQAETLPFFAENRVMVFSDTGLFKAGGDQLADYLKSPCESTVFIFCESEVDERSRLYKVLKENGTVAQIDEQTRDTLKQVMGSFLKENGKMITLATAERILDKTGNNMGMLRTELEKLVTYCIDKDVIEAEDVENVCCRNIEDDIFSLIDAVADKNAKKAMDTYYDMIALKTPPMKILSLIEREYNRLLQVKLLREDMEQPATIAGKMGIYPKYIGQYMTKASKYTSKELRDIFEKTVGVDESIKMGRISDTLAVETLILSLL